MENVNYLRKYAATLIDLGYEVIPLLTAMKRPVSNKWQKTKATQEQAAEWAKDPEKTGIGILSAKTPAIDIDVRDRVIANRLHKWVHENVGKCPSRYGERPKRILVFKASSPFTKVQSSTYVDVKGIEHKLEILGHGQQFVAFNIHPKTGKPFEWPGTQITDIPVDELTELTEDKAKEMVSFFESIIPQEWEIKTPSSAKKADKAEGAEITGDLSTVKPTLDITRAEIEKYLAMIPSDDYDVWMRVGMALYHQYEGKREGFLLWDEWSKKSDKYTGDEPGNTTEYRWPTFKEGDSQNPVTFASVITMSKGYENDYKKRKRKEYEDRYIFIEVGSRVWDKTQSAGQSPLLFREFTLSKAMEYYEVEGPKGGVKQITYARDWVQSKGRRTVRDVTYAPGEGAVVQVDGANYLNTFRLPKHPKIGGDDRLAPFLDHMKFTIPCDTSRARFLDWLAYKIQNPHVKATVTPLHINIAQRSGRGWITKVISALVGSWNVSEVSMSEFSGENNAFNGYMSQNLFLFIEEIDTIDGSRYKLLGKIKNMLTATHLLINEKFRPAEQQRVYANIFMMSNSRDALALNENDARLDVLFGKNETMKEPHQIKIHKWFGGQEYHTEAEKQAQRLNIAQLYGWLKNRDVSGYNAFKTVHSEALAQIIEESKSETETGIEAFLKSMGDLPLCMSSTEISERLIAREHVTEHPSAKAIAAILKRKGYTSRAISVGGKTVRCWTPATFSLQKAKKHRLDNTKFKAVDF
jgi:hypothetical protein